MASELKTYFDRPPHLLAFRSSKAFIIFVVSYAIFVVSTEETWLYDLLAHRFKDQFVFAVIVPVMPFTLHEHVGVPDTSGMIGWMSGQPDRC